MLEKNNNNLSPNLPSYPKTSKKVIEKGTTLEIPKKKRGRPKRRKKSERYYLVEDKRRSRWIVQIKEVQPDGKYKSLGSDVIGLLSDYTRKQAEREFERWKLERIASKLSVKTIGECWEEYVSTELNDKFGWKRSSGLFSKSAIDDNIARFKVFIHHFDKDFILLQPVNKLTNLINKFLNDKSKTVKTTTLDRYRCVVTPFHNWCQKTQGVTGIIKVPEVSEKKKWEDYQSTIEYGEKHGHVFSNEELDEIFKAAESSGNRLAVMIASYTGLRVGEIWNLKWPCISSDWNYIYPEVVKGTHTQRMLKRMIPLHETLKEELLKIPEEERTGRILHKRPSSSLEVIKGFIDLGYPKINWHMFRSTFASRCVAAGVKPEALMQMLGHKDYKTTLQHYNKHNFAEDVELPFK